MAHVQRERVHYKAQKVDRKNGTETVGTKTNLVQDPIPSGPKIALYFDLLFLQHSHFNLEVKNQSFAGGGRVLEISMTQNFFKVILQNTIDDNKLELPKLFVRNFGNELSNVTKVVIPNGGFWHIGLSRNENKVWFEDGLDKLLKHYSIREGHLLLFFYKSDSTFHVAILDDSACEICYPNQVYGSIIGDNEQNFGHDKGKMEDDDSFDILEDDFMPTVILDSDTAGVSRGRNTIKKKVPSSQMLHRRAVTISNKNRLDETEMLAKHKEK
ncbi:unnamed protein product [Dovyalis caffra]|uniref:TF-B3 domain-containing protein n=1 Tax=Dovyalis caffra TaxID=77055 RepID=A0AAV1SCC9_9ROSI|nr:unnamed protein product [Dovyalis caffra]